MQKGTTMYKKKSLDMTRYRGLSTDTKPNADIGSTFHEMDTGVVYMYDGDAWNEMPDQKVKEKTAGPAAIASFTTSLRKHLKSILVNMSPIQSGTGDPSPENVRPISGRQSVGVWRDNINILPLPTAGAYTYTLSVDSVNADGSITITKTSSSGWGEIPLMETRLPAGTYTLIEDAPSDTLAGIVVKRVSDNTNIADTRYNLRTTFTLSEATDVRIIYTKATACDNLTIRLMMAVGNTATLADFAPFNRQTVQIPLGQTVYGGTVDVTTGEMVVDRAIMSLTGSAISSAWSDTDLNSIGFYRSVWDYSAEPIPVETGGIFDYCKMGSVYNNDNAWTARFLCSNGTFNRFEIRLPKNVLATENVAGAKAYLNEHPLQACYKIAPFTVQLTPQQLKLLKGTNNVWTDAGNVTVTYLDKK